MRCPCLIPWRLCWWRGFISLHPYIFELSLALFMSVSRAESLVFFMPTCFKIKMIVDDDDIVRNLFSATIFRFLLTACFQFKIYCNFHFLKHKVFFTNLFFILGLFNGLQTLAVFTMFVGITFPFFSALLGFFGGFAFAPTTYFVSLCSVILLVATFFSKNSSFPLFLFTLWNNLTVLLHWPVSCSYY